MEDRFREGDQNNNNTVDARDSYIARNQAVWKLFSYKKIICLTKADLIPVFIIWLYEESRYMKTIIVNAIINKKYVVSNLNSHSNSSSYINFYFKNKPFKIS